MYKDVNRSPSNIYIFTYPIPNMTDSSLTKHYRTTGIFRRYSDANWSTGCSSDLLLDSI